VGNEVPDSRFWNPESRETVGEPIKEQGRLFPSDFGVGLGTQASIEGVLIKTITSYRHIGTVGTIIGGNRGVGFSNHLTYGEARVNRWEIPRDPLRGLRLEPGSDRPSKETGIGVCIRGFGISPQPSGIDQDIVVGPQEKVAFCLP